MRAAPGDYARAKRAGCDVRALMFEVWGGWSPEVVELFRDLADEVSNRLSKQQYDETTWSARTWLSFQAQKVSVALHYAVALEISQALGLATAKAQMIMKRKRHMRSSCRAFWVTACSTQRLRASRTRKRLSRASSAAERR